MGDADDAWGRIYHLRSRLKCACISHSIGNQNPRSSMHMHVWFELSLRNYTLSEVVATVFGAFTTGSQFHH